MAGIERSYITPDYVYRVCVRWSQGWPCDYAAVVAHRRGYRAGRGACECAPPLYILNVDDMTVWRQAA